MKEDVKLSNQQRTHVLGLYIGGKVRYKNEFGTYETIIDGLFIGKYMATGIYFKIILTPLSEITDEDARELCKILGEYCPENAYLSKQKDNALKREWSRLSYMSYDWLEKRQTEHIILNFSDDGLHGGKSIYYPSTGQRQADFLRLRGYALPYMGIDLYEAGIAIKPTAVSPSQA